MKTRRGTTTITAKQITADAISQYKSNLRTVRGLLRELSGIVDEHERDALGSPNDWGYVGDMGKTADELLGIKKFLTGR